VNIYEKLVEVRKSVPYLQKTQSGAQYKYVGSSDVLGAIRKAMDELGILVIPRVKTTNVITSEGTNQRGGTTTKYFTEGSLEYTIINTEQPDETIVIPWYAQGLDTEGEKGVGKLLTYGEKYLFLKLFNIATDKDDPDAFQEKRDGNNDADGHKPAERPKSSPKATPPAKHVEKPTSQPESEAVPIRADDEQTEPKREKPQPDPHKQFASFFASAKNLGYSDEDIHREAAPYFGIEDLTSLKDVPDLNPSKLGQFLLHLREMQNGGGR
jgi:hypothetical protein